MTLAVQRPRRRRLVIPRGSLGEAQAPYTTVLGLDRGRHGARHLAAFAVVLAVHAFIAGAVVFQHETVAHPPAPPPHPDLRAALERVPAPPPLPPPPPPSRPPPQPDVDRSPTRAEAPPAPAQAGQVLAQVPTPGEPADLTGFDLVVGEAKYYAGGVSSAKGTSQHEVVDSRARVGGVPDAPRAPDLSRPAAPANSDWGCSWPEEAQETDVRSARVTIRVSVRPDGWPAGVEVLSAPPGGFAEAARRCAENEIYRSALDRSGKPVAGNTHPFNVHFLR